MHVQAKCRDCGVTMTAGLPDGDDPYQFANQQFSCNCGNKNWEISTY